MKKATLDVINTVLSRRIFHSDKEKKKSMKNLLLNATDYNFN